MGLINIFDIMEISLDLKYINQYGTLWIVVYDICVGIALLSIAFPIEISSDDLAWSKITVMDLSDKPDLTLNNSNFDVKNERIRKSYGAIVLDDGENKNNQIEHKENSPIPIDESVDKMVLHLWEVLKYAKNLSGLMRKNHCLKLWKYQLWWFLLI